MPGASRQLQEFYDNMDIDLETDALEALEDLADGEYFDMDEDDEDYVDDDETYDEDDVDFYDNGEEDEDGEEEDDLGNATILSDPNAVDDVDEPMDSSLIETSVSFAQLASMLNNTPSADARQSLLARLLAEPSSGTSGGLRSWLSGRVGGIERPSGQRERKRDVRWWEEQKEPHPDGLALLKSGEFGRVGEWCIPGKRRGRMGIRYAGGLAGRQRGWVPPSVQTAIPNTPGTVVASYPSIPYVGQYCGEDYGVFYTAHRLNRYAPVDTATQYFTLHLYSTTQPKGQPKRRRQSTPKAATPAPLATAAGDDDEWEDEDDDDGQDWGNWGDTRRGMATEDTSMKKIKTVQGEEGRWTITDCDADRKGEKMIYSSITPYVHMLYTAEHDSAHICLDFTGGGSGRGQQSYGYDSFGIWSIRFSADGKEVVAGAGSGKIMVYDIESQRRSLSVPGHADDVNAVCFADESSTNILVSGSDDGYVKVWDRRSLSSHTPSGVLVGATEGITYTSPKGDGRYVVVNSKDQAARLYDLRKMRSHSEFESESDAVSRYGQPRYDYRNSRYPPPQRLAHPKDCSVMTYRGHAVLRTLIRCHFSPRESTGQNYIYSGSADGKIHIWSLDGRVVQVLDRSLSTPLRDAENHYSDPSAPDPSPEMQRARRATGDRWGHEYASQAYCVRDVSWHGYEPTLMSTCWEMDGGYRRGGTLAKHEWKGLGKGGLKRLEDWTEKRAAEECE